MSSDNLNESSCEIIKKLCNAEVLQGIYLIYLYKFHFIKSIKLTQGLKCLSIFAICGY